VVRGGSHSGNVAAIDLAREGVLDGLSSDYVPSSLLQAAWLLHQKAQMPLYAAVHCVTAGPAHAAGLTDVGSIAPGLRADLIHVRELGNYPVVFGVYQAGVREA
jgi:alpha-D-ribose 1-methylphosphonate 5-triphosphate diphosphatase